MFTWGAKLHATAEGKRSAALQMRVSIVGSSADQEACSLYIWYADQADDKADEVLLNAYQRRGGLK
jgi:hypothetical protein